MNLPGLLMQLKCLRNTVHTEYGKSLRAWFSFVYYSLFRINTFCIFRVSLENSPDTATELSGVSFASPLPGELDAFRGEKELPREFFCDRIHKVGLCYLAKVDEEIAYIHWVYFRGDYSRFLKLGNDSAEINYVITLPPFRGHGISTATFLYTMRDLKKRGVKHLFAVVHNENVASIKAFTRAGFVEIGRTFSIGPFNRKIAV